MCDSQNIVPDSDLDEDISPKSGGIFYGWWIVGVGVFLLTLQSLSVFRGMGVMLVVLQKEFSWSRTQISLGTLFGRVEGAALGPIEGFLVDRIGARRMILVGFAIMAVGFFLFSFIQNIWQFYAVFIIITLGSGLGGWLAIMSVINSWFKRKRSIAMAGAMSGINIAGFFLPLYAIAMESDFRMTAVILGGILLVVVVPAVKIIRNSPEEMGLLVDGGIPEKDIKTNVDPDTSIGIVNQSYDEPEFTVGQAIRTPVFWILTVAHISSTISIATLSLHLTPRLTDMGLTLTTASYIETTYSVVALPSLFISGWLGDKVSKKYLITLFLVLQGISTFVLAFSSGLGFAILFAILYGIAFGGRIPLMTSIRGEYFGRKAFATIMGWSMLPNGILMAIAPVWAGWMFDSYGSYTIPFVTYATLSIIGSVIMLFARKPNMIR
tara:strand:+ start:517 stop:1827 length:1311 start_codon:yes stop_codon:yes gene_type:complete